MRSVLLTVALLVLTVSCAEDDPTTPKPDPPVALTGAVTNLDIGAGTATANGTVDPSSSETTWWFEYGPGDTLEVSTADSSLTAAATGAHSVAATLEGLEPNSEYGFRLVARNAGGVSHGSVVPLLTPSANLAPDTHIVGATPDTVGSTVSWHLYWFGTDSDGVAVRFELRVVDHGADGSIDPPDSAGVAWTSTTVTDSVVSWANGLGSRTAFVRAVDDRGAKDPSPAAVTVEALESAR